MISRMSSAIRSARFAMLALIAVLGLALSACGQVVQAQQHVSEEERMKQQEKLAKGDFTLDDEGRLVDFTIDDEPLDDRLLVDGPSTTVAGVKARVVSAFELVSNDSPVVVVEIDNGGRGRFRLVDADYTAPDGLVFTTSPSGGGLVVPRGTTSRAVLAFATARFGGTVTLHGAVGEAPVEIALPLTP